MHNIKMAQKYKIRNTLKNLPFYNEWINNFKKNNKKFTNARFLSELPFFSKKRKKFSKYQFSKELPFFPKRPKKLKKISNTKKYAAILWQSRYLKKTKSF